VDVCLDTNAYSAFNRGRDALTAVLERADRVYVPTIVLGELYAGFSMGTRYDQNVAELDAFLALPGVQVAVPTREVAERYGVVVRELRGQGTPLPTNDIWIAASALELGARLLSYDSHFTSVPGLLVVAP
jgi:tRNA(fMet)-specific endonuclease VapC